MGEVDYNTAREAVRYHYARETRWIMPSDVLTYNRRFGPRPPKAVEATPASFNRSEEQQAYVAENVAKIRAMLKDLFKPPPDVAKEKS
jgi:hypothetical protein